MQVTVSTLKEQTVFTKWHSNGDVVKIGHVRGVVTCHRDRRDFQHRDVVSTHFDNGVPASGRVFLCLYQVLVNDLFKATEHGSPQIIL